MVANRAVKAGATLWTGTEAVEPVVDGGPRARRRRCAPPARRHRDRPGPLRRGRRRLQLALRPGARHLPRPQLPPGVSRPRGYFESPYHDEPWIESHLDLRDRHGNHLPGYGWVFPLGDGTVNVGIGLLSTFAGWKDVNTSQLMEAFCETAPARWGISPDTACGPPTGGKLPTGLSVFPKVGPTWCTVGDAAGAVNPFNGEGISVAYETGRLAADALDEALRGDGLALQGYPARLEERYGLYFKVARVFVRAIGNPAVMRELTRVGMHSRPLMEWVLRIMANLLRPDELGPAEAAYKVIARVVAVVPEKWS